MPTQSENDALAAYVTPHRAPPRHDPGGRVGPRWPVPQASHLKLAPDPRAHHPFVQDSGLHDPQALLGAPPWLATRPPAGWIAFTFPQPSPPSFMYGAAPLKREHRLGRAKHHRDTIRRRGPGVTGPGSNTTEDRLAMRHSDLHRGGAGPRSYDHVPQRRLRHRATAPAARPEPPDRPPRGDATRRRATGRSEVGVVIHLCLMWW